MEHLRRNLQSILLSALRKAPHQGQQSVTSDKLLAENKKLKLELEDSEKLTKSLHEQLAYSEQQMIHPSVSVQLLYSWKSRPRYGYFWRTRNFCSKDWPLNEPFSFLSNSHTKHCSQLTTLGQFCIQSTLCVLSLCAKYANFQFAKMSFSLGTVHWLTSSWKRQEWTSIWLVNPNFRESL